MLTYVEASEQMIIWRCTGERSWNNFLTVSSCITVLRFLLKLTLLALIKAQTAARHSERGVSSDFCDREHSLETRFKGLSVYASVSGRNTRDLPSTPPQPPTRPHPTDAGSARRQLGLKKRWDSHFELKLFLNNFFFLLLYGTRWD